MDKRTFRIGQIADVHLIADNDEADHLKSVESFEKTLADADKFDLDLFVISGDMTEHSFPQEYQLFFEMMKAYSGKWCMIAGNHDKSADIARYSPFPIELHHGEYFYKKTVNEVALFFLDSSTDSVSKSQLEWLKEEAAKESKEIFIFMHHPPCLCGHLFMDSRYALKNWNETKSVMEEIPNLRAIFTGHYHSAMEVNLENGKKVYLTPATQMQLNPDVSEFNIISTVPGWRYIEYKNEKISTELRYL